LTKSEKNAKKDAKSAENHAKIGPNMPILGVILAHMRMIPVVMENNNGVNMMSIEVEKPLCLSAKALYEKLEKLMVSKGGNLLPSVKLKGKGGGYYYSASDKSFIYMDRNAELYLLPWKRDEKGRLYLYSPYTFKQGVIILAEEDEIILIGFN
jgi:hypothetical protein